MKSVEISICMHFLTPRAESRIDFHFQQFKFRDAKGYVVRVDPRLKNLTSVPAYASQEDRVNDLNGKYMRLPNFSKAQYH